MNETHFLMTLIEWLKLPFKISDALVINDDNDIFTVTMKDGRKFIISAEDVRKVNLMNQLLLVLPFSIDDISETEENCSTVWITLHSGKVYSLTVTECEEDQIELKFPKN